MESGKKVHILMATYNGEAYLEEQLSSIGRQTMKNWILHIRDDASSDRTMEIIEDFRRKFPDQVSVKKNSNNIGAKENFAGLLTEIKEPGDYAFCDQDDIWREDKLELMQKKLREEEKNTGGSILLYSDAVLIDGAGETLADSFVENSRLYLPERHVFERLLLYNFAQGAAMLWNWQLQQLLTEIPGEALMHDWWVALVAAGHGCIVYMPDKLSKYRQHGKNVLGDFDRKKWHRSFLEKLSPRNWKRLVYNNHMLRRERNAQVETYFKLYGDARAKKYLFIMKQKHFKRAWLGISNGYLFLSWKYSLKYYLL